MKSLSAAASVALVGAFALGCGPRPQPAPDTREADAAAIREAEQVGLGFIVPTALAFAAITLFLGWLALTSQLRRSVTGVDGMIGVGGRARDVVGPDEPGNVDIHGEIWRAQSASRSAAGQPVRVTAVNGLTLTVEPSGAPAQDRLRLP